MQQSKLKKFRHIHANLLIALCLVTLLSLTFLTNSTNVLSSNNKLTPLYHGDKSSKKVSLMINVYWGSEFIPEMLKVLEEEDVVATFFVGGMWATKENKLLIDIANAGHEIANHGYYHKDHDKISYERNIEEISLTKQVIYDICGIETNLFMPPSGAFNQTTLKASASASHKTIMWSKDTIDWRDQDKTLIYNRATQNIEGGDLILMHPTKATSLILIDIIKSLKNAGWELVSVSDNISTVIISD